MRSLGSCMGDATVPRVLWVRAGGAFCPGRLLPAQEELWRGAHGAGVRS